VSPTLFRLVAKLYLGLFVLALVGVVLIALVADFGDRLNTFLNKPLSDIAALYGNKLLVTVYQLSPAAMLLAAGASISVLRQRSEWTAMQALGASRWTLVGPVVTCAGLLALGLIGFDEVVVTHAGEQVDIITVQRFQRWGDFGFYYFPKQWFRVGSSIIQVRGASEPSGRLLDVTLYRLDEHFRLAARVDGRAMTSRGGTRWLVEDAVERTFDAAGQSALSPQGPREVELPGTDPQTFRVRQGRPEQMPFADLLEQRQIRAKVGLPIERYSLAMHNRFAYPLTGVAAAFLALTLALRPSRRGHLTLALIEGLFVSVALFAFMLIGKALVLGEHLAPGVAAWAPTVGLVVLAAGLWLAAEGQLWPRARR